MTIRFYWTMPIKIELLKHLSNNISNSFGNEPYGKNLISLLANWNDDVEKMLSSYYYEKGRTI